MSARGVVRLGNGPGRRAEFEWANSLIEKRHLVAADLCGINAEGARFEGCDLRRVQLRAAILSFADLSRSLLAGVDMRDAVAIGVQLRGRNLDQARLERGDLAFADLRDSSLLETRLDGACLDSARLDGANLRGASLRDSMLRGASLCGATLTDACLEGSIASASTRWPTGFDAREAGVRLE